MNTKFLMMCSAVVMAFPGFTASFLPMELLTMLGMTANELPILFMQITGALYLGFAIMNWMAKTVLMGGIYARPLAMGNFLHFTVVALALFKFTLNSHQTFYAWAATLVYSIFAVLFGIVVFTSPKQVVANGN